MRYHFQVIRGWDEPTHGIETLHVSEEIYGSPDEALQAGKAVLERYAAANFVAVFDQDHETIVTFDMDEDRPDWREAERR